MATSLNSADRDFFAGVSEAAFANPFSPQRAELDSRIAGKPLTESERIPRLREAVASRVAKLEQAGRAHLKHFRGEDLLVMRNAFLFETYHCYCDGLDELIMEQLKSGDAP